MDKSKDSRQKSVIMGVALCLLVGWIYWYPALRTGYYYRVDPEGFPNADFYAYYVAGGAYHLGLDPYLDHRQQYPQLNNPRIKGFSGYIYPPTALPLYELLASFRYKYARAIWACMNLGMLLSTFLLMLKRIGKEDRFRLFLIGAILILTSVPLLTHIQQGQLDMIVSSLSMLAFLEYKAGRKLVSAILICLGIFLKLNPVVLLATFVLYKKDYKYFLLFIASFVVLFGFSLLFIPLSYYTEFFTKVLPVITQSRGYYTNQSLIRLFAYHGAQTLQISAGGLLIFAFFAWLTGWRRRRVTSFEISDEFVCDAVFLMNILVMLLFVGLAWTMAYTWVILPSSLVLLHLWKRSSSWYMGIIILANIFINSRVEGEIKFLDRLNMTGGLILLISLMVMVIVPRVVLKDRNCDPLEQL
jgi:hypothetical protein